MALSNANFIFLMLCCDGASDLPWRVLESYWILDVFSELERAFNELSIGTSFVSGVLFFTEICHFQFWTLFFVMLCCHGAIVLPGRVPGAMFTGDVMTIIHKALLELCNDTSFLSGVLFLTEMCQFEMQTVLILFVNDLHCFCCYRWPIL
jgi:hypothetical protein